jgi:hypothetical protein
LEAIAGHPQARTNLLEHTQVVIEHHAVDVAHVTQLGGPAEQERAPERREQEPADQAPRYSPTESESF